MSDITRILNDDILPRANKLEIFADLNPQDKGDYIVTDCPHCKTRGSAFINKASTYLKCNRDNNCQFSTSIYDYMNGGTTPSGEAWWKITEKLAAMAGVTLPEYEHDEETIAQHQQRNELERQWAQTLEAAPLASEYLSERRLHGAMIGFIPPGAGHWAPEWYNRIVLPIRDRYGNLVGMVGRDTTGGALKKYLYTKDVPLKEIGFIGIDEALKARGDTIILVEGVIDRIRLALHGVKNVVALGQASITSEKFALLNELGYRKVILALDNDEAGRKGTRDAIERAYEQLIPPEVLVHTYQNKDADEDLNDEIAWKDRKELQAHAWLAQELVDTHKDIEKLIDAVTAFDEKIKSPLRIAHMALHFNPVIEAQIDLFGPTLMELYTIRRQKNIQKKSNDLIQDAARRAKILGNDGKHDEAKEALFEGYRESEALIKVSRLEPIRTLNERLLEHEAGIMANRDRPLLGLATDMKELTGALMGLRGLVFLGSAPNLGKTVLSVQLALQVLRNEPEACVVYINLDMDTGDVLTRIRCNIGEFEWKKFTVGHDIPIDTGRDKVRQIGDRLIILDQRCFNGDAEAVIEIINSFKKRTKTKRVFIVLDYLQVWEVPEDKRKILRSEQDVDEWRVAIVKQLKAHISRHDCMLAISEVRKEGYNRELGMEDLKGSSRLSYAADVVLLLQRLTPDDYCEWFEMYPTGIGTHMVRRSIENMDEKEKKKEAKKIQEFLERESITVGWLQVAKGRDGTQRKKIPVTAYFKTASIVEGFHIDGIPKQEVQDDGNGRSEGVDEGTVHGDADERTGEWWQK